jgi:hypothetical protein
LFIINQIYLQTDSDRMAMKPVPTLLFVVSIPEAVICPPGTAETLHAWEKQRHQPARDEQTLLIESFP